MKIITALPSTQTTDFPGYVMKQQWIEMLKSYLVCVFSGKTWPQGFISVAGSEGDGSCSARWVPTAAQAAALQRMHNPNTGARPPKYQHSAGGAGRNLLYY